SRGSSGTSFVAEISVTHVTPAEAKAFVVVQVAKRRPPVYWCAANSCNRKQNERLRASPDLRKVADTRPSERKPGLSAAGRVLKVGPRRLLDLDRYAVDGALEKSR